MSKRKASESHGESDPELDDEHEDFGLNAPPPPKRRRRLPVEAYKYVTMQLNGHAYFSCTRCGSRYKFRKSLNKHWRDKHSDSPQQQSAEAGISLLLAAANASTSIAASQDTTINQHEDSLTSTSSSPIDDKTTSSTVSKATNANTNANVSLSANTSASLPSTSAFLRPALPLDTLGRHLDEKSVLKFETNNNHIPLSAPMALPLNTNIDLAALQANLPPAYMPFGVQNPPSQMPLLSANLVRPRFPFQTYYPVQHQLPFGGMFVNPCAGAPPSAGLFAPQLGGVNNEQLAQLSSMWYQQQWLNLLQQRANAHNVMLNNNNNNVVNNNNDEKPPIATRSDENVLKPMIKPEEMLKMSSPSKVLDLSSKEPRITVRTAIRNPLVGDQMWNPKPRRLSLPHEVVEIKRDDAEHSAEPVCLDLSRPSSHVTPNKARRLTLAFGERERPASSSAARSVCPVVSDEAQAEANELACFLCGYVGAHREDVATHILTAHNQLINKDAFVGLMDKDADRTDGSCNSNQLECRQSQLDEGEEGSLKQKLKERLHERVSNMKRPRASLGNCSPRASAYMQGGYADSTACPFMCPVCHWKARWISELKSHLTNHTTYKPYCCCYCDYRSKWKWDVVKHLKRCGAADLKLALDDSVTCKNLELASNKELSRLVLFRPPDGNVDEVSSLLVRLQESPKEQAAKCKRRPSKSKKELPNDVLDFSQSSALYTHAPATTTEPVACGSQLHTPQRNGMSSTLPVTPTLRNVPYGALPATPQQAQAQAQPPRPFMQPSSLGLPSPFAARFQPSILPLQQALPDFYTNLYHAHCAQMNGVVQSVAPPLAPTCNIMPLPIGNSAQSMMPTNEPVRADLNSNVICSADADNNNVKVDSVPHTHHRENATFACDECGYRARNGGDLKRHKLRHSSFKPFACATCSYQSKWKCDLKKHLAKYSHISAINMAIDRRRHRGKSFDEVLKMHRQLVSSNDSQQHTQMRATQLKNVRKILRGYKAVRASRLKMALLSTAKVLIRSALRRRYRRFMKSKSNTLPTATARAAETAGC